MHMGHMIMYEYSYCGGAENHHHQNVSEHREPARWKIICIRVRAEDECCGAGVGVVCQQTRHCSATYRAAPERYSLLNSNFQRLLGGMSRVEYS